MPLQFRPKTIWYVYVISEKWCFRFKIFAVRSHVGEIWLDYITIVLFFKWNRIWNLFCSFYRPRIAGKWRLYFLVIKFTLSIFFTEVRPCQYEGGLKEPGESFHSNDCQKKCTCSLQGELLCQPTVCPSGLEIRGNYL